ncbi:MAG: universal stress protein [Planctomycetes bacterium]|nr:universal stress protein [Planctomycetota bacterium]MBI3844085.1 universal stress protein [Planctomycetota bacterium]
MIGALLAAIDTSEFGAKVSDYAVFVARVFGSHVHALSVIETKKIEGPLLRDYLATVGLEPGLEYKDKVTRFLEAKARAILADLEGRCKAAGIPCDCEVTRGIAARLILERGQRCDLIVIGQKGEHGEWHGESLGGSVQGVVRASARPILVTPKKYRDITRAVVAYDGSQHSRQALQLAAEIARRTNLHFTVLTVDGGHATEDALRAEIATRIGPTVPAHEVAVRSGDPHRAILDVAERLDCQMIVMGAYGHSRIRELIIGSTTEQVLRSARIPVLLTR